MKLPEFNHAERKWDRFREFYNEIGVGVWFYQNTNPFIMLETGEFFLNRGRFAPDMRKQGLANHRLHPKNKAGQTIWGYQVHPG